MNPVIFDESLLADELTVYSEKISEIGWQQQLIGMTESGFLVVDKRVPKMGYYEFYPKVIPWDQVQEVSTRRLISVLGILFGIVAIFLGIAAFTAGWIEQTHTGPGIITLPLIFGAGGAVCVFGALRNRIVVRTPTKIFKWTSGPLTYKKTLSYCREAAEKARAHQVQLVQSHA